MEVIINFIITLWKKPMGKVFIGFFLFLVSGIMGWFIIEIKNDIWFVRLIFEGLAVIIALWGIIETPIKFTGRNAKIKRRRVILKKSVSILLILVGTYFGVVFTIHNSNRYLPREYKIMQEAQATREAEYWAGATEYALESSLRMTEQASEPTSETTIEPNNNDMSFPQSQSEVPICDFEEIKDVCKYFIEEGVYAYEIGIKVYSDKRLQGKVKEFYRDKNGNIPVWRSGINYFTLIPPRDMGSDLYEVYYSLLDIHKCQEEAPEKPCWYESRGEDYVTLSNQYYGDATYIECIQQANKIQYNGQIDGLEPLSMESGKIIVLPLCE